MKREIRTTTTTWLVAAGLLLTSAAGAQPSGTPESDVLARFSCKAGDEVAIPIEVAVPGAVALQLDLEHDGEMLALDQPSGTTVELAPGLEMSVHHLGRGAARVIVFGHGLEALPQGHLGDVHFRAVATSDETPVRALGRTASDAFGRSLPTTVDGGAIVASEGVR